MSRHEVRSPVQVKAPTVEDEEMTADAFALPADDQAESAVWFQAELRARFAAIDDKIKKLSALDRLEGKVDEVLKLAREQGERNDRLASPRNPKERTTFTNLAGVLRSNIKRPTLQLPPPPGRPVEVSTTDAGADEDPPEPERVSDVSWAQHFTRKVSEASEVKRSGTLPPPPPLPGRQSVSAHMQDEYARRQSQRRFVNMWQFFEDEESGILAKLYAQCAFPFIALTVMLSLIQALDDTMMRHASVVQIAEVCIEGLFLVDILARLLVMRTLCDFFLDAYNIIDIVSVLPLTMRGATGLRLFADDGGCDLTCSILVGVVPVIRLLKLLRRFQNFQLLLRAFALAFEALPVLLFIWAIVCLAAASMLWIFEPRDNVPTFGTSIWLSVVSMTTLGYGDYYPSSTMGRIIVSCLVVVSILYTAIPLGIIGSAFSEVWNDRFRILLTRRTRKRLQQAGYEARDIPYLFQIFDANQDDQLDIEEFKTMVEFMKVGFRGRRVVELFDLFDDDGSGAIDDREFVKALFPESFHELYGALLRQTEQVCKQCGNVNMSDDKFCKECGAKRPEEEDVKEEQERPCEKGGSPDG